MSRPKILGETTTFRPVGWPEGCAVSLVPRFTVQPWCDVHITFGDTTRLHAVEGEPEAMVAAMNVLWRGMRRDIPSRCLVDVPNHLKMPPGLELNFTARLAADLETATGERAASRKQHEDA